MHDGMGTPALDGAEATFRALRAEFVEDAAEDLKGLLSYLNEAIAGSRPVDEVLRGARRVAFMPDLDGIDLCIALKAMPATPNIGVAVITSLDRDDASLKMLPPTVPIIQKSASFGDDLVTRPCARANPSAAAVGFPSLS